MLVFPKFFQSYSWNIFKTEVRSENYLCPQNQRKQNNLNPTTNIRHLFLKLFRVSTIWLNTFHNTFCLWGNSSEINSVICSIYKVQPAVWKHLEITHSNIKWIRVCNEVTLAWSRGKKLKRSRGYTVSCMLKMSVCCARGRVVCMYLICFSIL